MPRVGGTPKKSMVYGEGQQFGPDEPSAAPDKDILVRLDDYRGKDGRTGSFKMQDSEAVEMEDGEDTEPSGSSDDHKRNLALDLDDKYLDELAAECIEEIVGDIQERQPWRDRFERGLELMGLVESDVDDCPFPGASNAVHPLLIEARTQFWARAMGELFPPDGPCKGKVEGAQVKPMLERAKRVSDYMNFDLTVQDEGYLDESSALVWDTPFYGSTFRKTF